MVYSNVLFHSRYLLLELSCIPVGTLYKNITSGDDVARNGLYKLLPNKNLSFTTWAMDYAAAGGHLQVIKWLHERAKHTSHEAGRPEGCTSMAFNGAARAGHFHIIKWLYENYPHIDSYYVMDSAAQGGHLEIIKWLHENVKRAGCTVGAMDWAAGNGHLHVVRWLHENRSEGCTKSALHLAVVYGHLPVTKWLCKNRSEGYSEAFIDWARSQQESNPAAKWLLDYLKSA